jgi:hypothetical protein
MLGLWFFRVLGYHGWTCTGGFRRQTLVERRLNQEDSDAMQGWKKVWETRVETTN